MTVVQLHFPDITRLRKSRDSFGEQRGERSKAGLKKFTLLRNRRDIERKVVAISYRHRDCTLFENGHRLLCSALTKRLTASVEYVDSFNTYAWLLDLSHVH